MTSPVARRAWGHGPARAGRPSSSALHMNLADRFLRVAKANLNNILQTWEDPEKVCLRSSCYSLSVIFRGGRGGGISLVIVLIRVIFVFKKCGSLSVLFISEFLKKCSGRIKLYYAKISSPSHHEIKNKIWNV